MPQLDGFPGVSGATDFAELRKLLGGLIVRNASGAPRAGILRDSTTPLITGRPDLKVDVARFPFLTVRNGGIVLGMNEGTTQVDLPALPTSNKRIDVLWTRQNISELGDPTDLPQFGWLSGDAAAIPLPPTAPLPAGALEVGRLQVSVGTTATNDASKVTISQPKQFTGLAGTSIPFVALTDLKDWTSASRDQLARVEGVPGDWRWDGAAWVPVTERTLDAVPPRVLFGDVPPAGTRLIRYAGQGGINTNANGFGGWTYPARFPNGVISASVVRRESANFGPTLVQLNTVQSLDTLNLRLYSTAGAPVANASGVPFSFDVTGW